MIERIVESSINYSGEKDIRIERYKGKQSNKSQRKMGKSPEQMMNQILARTRKHNEKEHT